MSLRILQIVESCAAGVGRHVMDLSGELLRLGHRVTLCYSPSRMDRRFRDELAGLSRTSGLQAHVLPVSPHLSLRDAGSMGQLRAAVRRLGDFDLAHCHSSKAGLVGRLALSGLGVPVIYTPHAPVTMDSSRGWAVRWTASCVEVCLSKLSRFLIAVSERERVHLEGIGIQADRIRVVPNGVAPRGPGEVARLRDAGRRKLGLTGSEVCIGFVGRLEPQKNPEMLIEACAGLPANVKVAVAGDGSLAPRLRSLACAAGLSRSIAWLPDGSGEEWMPAFDVFALTSRYEGHPYVLLEAMNAALPVVATNVGGTETLSAENACISPVGDVRVFREYLHRIAADGQLRRRMSIASLKHKDAHSLDRMVRGTVRVYCEALECTSRLERLCPNGSR